MKIRLLLLLFFLLAAEAGLHAQNKRKIDSLQQLLSGDVADTQRVLIYNTLSSEYRFTDPGRQKGFALKAMSLARQTDNMHGLASGYNMYGQALEGEGRYDAAISYYDSALTTWQQKGDKKNVARMNLNIANVYNKKADYPAAADYTIRSLKGQEEVNDKFGIAVCKMTLGNIYYSQGDLKGALQQYKEAIAMNHTSANNAEFEASVISNIGSMYQELGNYDSALYYQRIAIDGFLKHQMESRYGTGYNNMGSLFQKLGRYDSAMYYHRKALFYHRKGNHPDGVSSALVEIGEVYAATGKVDSALYYYAQGLAISKTIGARDDELKIYDKMSQAYEQKKDFESSLHYLQLYNTLYDSLHGSEQNNLINTLKKNYELDKVDQQLRVTKAEQLAADERNKRNTILFIALSMIGLLVTGTLFYMYTTKRRHNSELAFKNAQISQQKEEITSSINYAKRIQQAILPRQEEIKKLLPDSFVTWIPRDIVSGDFYWFVSKNGKAFIACADCTGHGVPGAFMSMIGNTLLNEIVLEKNVLAPDEILELLHQRIRQAMKQESREPSNVATNEMQMQDGMDLSFCVIDLATRQLSYAGANRPAYIVGNSTGVPMLTELSPDKQPIGGAQLDARKPFSKKEITLQPGDCLYLFSDGYPDQFGGDKGKKFMTRRFQDVIISLYGKPMGEQQRLLEENFYQWKAGHEQVDDVCVIGVRIG